MLAFACSLVRRSPHLHLIRAHPLLDGPGPSGHHRRRTDAGDGSLETVVKHTESVLVTVLNLVDEDTGWPLSTQVPRKGRESSAYVLDAVEQYEQYANTLWHKRVALQLDAGNARYWCYGGPLGFCKLPERHEELVPSSHLIYERGLWKTTAPTSTALLTERMLSVMPSTTRRVVLVFCRDCPDKL